MSIHPRVGIKVSRKKIPGLLAKAKIVHNAMLAAAATFTSPMPTMLVLLGLIQALDTAQAAVGTKGAGLAAQRDLKADALVSALGTERGYVQSLVDLNPEQGHALAELAGMSIAAVGNHVKPVVGVKQGLLPGTVAVEVNLGLLTQGRGKAKKTTVHLRATTDGGKTVFWTQSGPLAHATITGVPPMTGLGVQACVSDSGGTSDRTLLVTIPVH